MAVRLWSQQIKTSLFSIFAVNEKQGNGIEAGRGRLSKEFCFVKMHVLQAQVKHTLAKLLWIAINVFCLAPNPWKNAFFLSMLPLFVLVVASWSL